MLEVEIIRVPRFVQLEECMFISKESMYLHPHPKDIATLREFFRSEFRERIDGKKIYISRSHSSRSPEFESELIEKLRINAWEIIFAENIPLPLQIQEISSASVLCGVHGAGLTGILWLDSSSKTIELSSRNYEECFSFMSQVRGVDFNRIDYETPRMKSADELLAEIISISGF
jgi:capsular polysaccharide biosynthesis protein